MQGFLLGVPVRNLEQLLAKCRSFLTDQRSAGKMVIGTIDCTATINLRQEEGQVQLQGTIPPVCVASKDSSIAAQITSVSRGLGSSWCVALVFSDNVCWFRRLCRCFQRRPNRCHWEKQDQSSHTEKSKSAYPLGIHGLKFDGRKDKTPTQG